MKSQRPSEGCDATSCGCERGPTRRTFLKVGGVTAAALAAAGPLSAIAGPFEPADTADHFVPADKKLKPQWVKLLFARGERQFYEHDDLKMIGMPIGGITTGQVYLGGDGRLLHWDIFNQSDFSGFGDKNYFAGPPTSPTEQGFVLSTVGEDGKPLTRSLDRTGFPNVRFCGEYPMAWVEYADKSFPISATLEAFSPFCPLKEEDSSLPVTVMRFTLRNGSNRAIDATLLGILENAVARFSADAHDGVRINQTARGEGWAMVLGSARAIQPTSAPRPPIVIEDFEAKDYGKWTVEGEAFGKGPAHGTLPNQQPVTGFQGKGLVNSFLGGGDRGQGKLTSPPLTIQRKFLCFLIGGGNHPGTTCINLLLEGKAARTATGKNDEKLDWQFWDVRDLAGKEVRIEIVNAESGPWGHINIDQIEQRDVPPSAFSGPLEKQADFGTMGLAVLEEADVTIRPDWRPGAALSDDKPSDTAEAPLSGKLRGSIAKRLRLAPGEAKTVTFVVAWHFANRAEHGNRYAVRFKDAADVVRHAAANFQRLHGQTKLWHQTWYEDSTLPRWLLDRLFSSVSTLATGTCQWWANGRFWAWEGVGCCEGTCAHVWNYEHALARLFPALERSVRTMQDLEPSAGFDKQTGAVRFRGEGWKLWAGDSQGGTALKCLREHQTGHDGEFLKRYWPRIRKTIQFLIDQDGNGDGLIEGRQHSTYDIDLYGANTMVGSLYLGALRAGEEMAGQLDDRDFAATCRRIYQAGVRNTLQRLWNGEYFIQQVDLAKHPKNQYATGCLADQLFGQGWAHQVGLGYLYPKENVRSALRALWTYNWTPDVGPQNAQHPPQRWFARPGEAGLFTCTWPKSRHLGPDSILYRDEVWTGSEYQVAGHMAWEGMLTEALAICRGVHERYHPSRHNPWNEIECGDHYARAMAAHGVFLALCGFEYHGPNEHIGFAPSVTPENFAAAFTCSEGWGTFTQKIVGGVQTAELKLRFGKLAVRTFSLGLPPGAKPSSVQVTLAGQAVQARLEVGENKAVIRLADAVTINEDQTIVISLQ